MSARVAPAQRPRLTFYVQHLLGMGHLVRAARIARALAATAFDVTLVMGGQAPPDFDIGRATLLGLPPVKAGAGGFSALVHPDGTPFDDAARQHRAALLLEHFNRFAPDVLVIEAFPFGRRQMRFELLPLLERAKARRTPPLIAASVRDILQRDKRPERSAETLAAIDRFFDLVLVHGDPRLVKLDASFPAASQFADKIAYTGLVAPEPVPDIPGSRSPYAVVVSVGGGAVGAPTIAAALRARPLTRLAQAPWLVLTGPNMPAAFQHTLVAQDGVTIRPFVPNLATLLADATVSISQAGYNTVADLFVAGCRAVLIPFAAGGETEQGDRATILARQGLAVVAEEAGLTAERMAAAIDTALDLPPAAHALDLDGARTTAEILTDRLVRPAS